LTEARRRTRDIDDTSKSTAPLNVIEAIATRHQPPLIGLACPRSHARPT
jgi:hypothetical protein